MSIEKLKSYRPESLAKEKHTIGVRRPYVDVGEFLPKLAKGYREIARISLRSSTGDVISIRLKKLKTGYTVDIVDEYENEYTGYRKLYADIPTQGEVFQIIADMGTADHPRSMWIELMAANELERVSEMLDFMYLDSNLYPDLNILLKHYFKSKGYR